MQGCDAGAERCTVGIGDGVEDVGWRWGVSVFWFGMAMLAESDIRNLTCAPTIMA